MQEILKSAGSICSVLLRSSLGLEIHTPACPHRGVTEATGNPRNEPQICWGVVEGPDFEILSAVKGVTLPSWESPCRWLSPISATFS
jgi:hypothetical protein